MPDNRYCTRGCQGPRGYQGIQGIQGIQGPPGPPGVTLSNFLSSAVVFSTTVSSGDDLIFGPTTNISGNTIGHINNTTTISLSGGQTYQVMFSTNGNNVSTQQGMRFAIVVNNFETDLRVVSQNLVGVDPYNSGTFLGYIVTPPNVTGFLSIRNVGTDTIANVNCNISILQITNN